MPAILVVDDCVHQRRLLEYVLNQAGYETVVKARDVEEALRILTTVPIDLVVTDVQMPQVDGMDLLQEIQEKFPGLPVVMTTSQGDEQLVLKALELGAATYVPKRLLMKELPERIEGVLSTSRAANLRQRLRRQSDRQLLRFRLTNDLNLVPELVAEINELLNWSNHFPDRDRTRIGVATEEAVLNAMIHGNLEVSSELKNDPDQQAFPRMIEERRRQSPYRDRKVTVIVKSTSKAFRLVVADEGPGFDPSTLPDPTDPENMSRAFGRGLLLISSFMDEVRHNARGNRVTMTKLVQREQNFIERKEQLPKIASAQEYAAHDISCRVGYDQ